jgi:hypothetical protein
MILIKNLGLYILCGTIWTAWFETYTIKELPPPYNQDWTNRERIYHITTWPVSLVVFIYSFIKEVMKQNKK